MKRIASTGGHSFRVRNPPGHAQISEKRATEIKFLDHKIDSISIDSIHGTGSLMDIKRAGVHFTIQTSGSTKKRATHDFQIDILKVIKKGYQFFENKFTGIVYGQGVWDRSWWTGEILLGLNNREEEEQISRIIRVA